MRDYTQKIHDLSSDVQKRIDKDINNYISSYERKQTLKKCYDRQLSHFAQGKKLPFTHEDFLASFSAKNFFKDLDDCGSWLEFRHWVDHDKTKLHHGNFCKRDKLCPACAVRRAYKQQNKFMSIIEQNPDLLDRDWYYIVIPVRHSADDKFEDVMALIETMKKKISMQMRNARRGKSSGFFSRFDGGMFSIEVTHSANGWNVHLNLLMNAPRRDARPARTFWRTDGRSVLGGLKKHTQIYKGKKKTTYSSPELSDWLRQFNNSHINSVTPLDFSNKDEIRGNLVEILKYALKFSDLTDQKLIEVFIKTRKKRLFGTLGNLWGKGLENVSLDGDEQLTGEFIELIFTRSFVAHGTPSDTPTYQLYKREVKKEDVNPIIFEHTFGVVVPKIAVHKKYYNSAPLIIVPGGGTKFNIRKKL